MGVTVVVAVRLVLGVCVAVVEADGVIDGLRSI